MADPMNEEKLDSPLVVHKVTDASYHETANNIDVDITHIEEETATLERHRFRREKKSSKLPYVLVAVVLIIAVFCYLYFSGALKGKEAETTEPTEVQTITEANRFKGIITVKESYIFFEGEEVDGIEGLIDQIKYLDAGTKFIVQDENADDSFLGENVLVTLSEYGIEYEVKFVISSGLTSKYETPAEPESTAAEPADEQTAQ